VTKTAALLWTDGRYHLQARQQLKGEWKLMRTGEDVSLEDWLAKVSICADETQFPILVHIFLGLVACYSSMVTVGTSKERKLDLTACLILIF
jgi:hypothetical protein